MHAPGKPFPCLRVGFAGAGTIARDRHVPGFRAIPNVSLVAVANRTEASSRAAAQEFGFERTAPDWQALVAADDVDAIVIGTWPYLHAEITVAALAAGKHVLSQARMAMNAAEARRMTDAAAAARARGLATLLVPASHTYWVDATISRLLADGAIGTLRTFHGVWNEPDVNEPGEWWRHQRRFSGNNVQGIGPLYEVLLRWLPAPAVAVTARTDLFEARKSGPDGPIEADNPDHASILLEYADGTAGSLEVSSHSAARGSSTITLVGSEGALRVDLRARSLERQDARTGAWRPIVIDPADVEEWAVEAEFVGAVRGEREVRRNPFEVGVAYMAFSDAVVESAATGRRVEIPASTRSRPRRGGDAIDVRAAAPKATAEEES